MNKSRQGSFNHHHTTVFTITSQQVMSWIKDLADSESEDGNDYVLNVKDKVFYLKDNLSLACRFSIYLAAKNPDKYGMLNYCGLVEDDKRLGNFIMKVLLDNGFKPI